VGERRRWLAATVLAVAVLLSGCAHVPTGGPPVAVRKPADDAAAEGVTTDVNAGLPRPGSQAEETVSAYVNALATTHNTSVLGDQFLVPAARQAFAQNSPVEILRGLERSAKPSGDTAMATFTAARVGEVDVNGVFTSAIDPHWTREADLERRNGEWRFVEPPPVMVLVDAFGGVYSDTPVYFAARPATGGAAGSQPHLLIPEQRYVDDGAGATLSQKVDFLLAGPSRQLGAIARNPLPGVKRTGRVQQDGRDVVVELSPDAETASADALNAFVAEVAWTLNLQVDGRVRLRVGARSLQVKNVQPNQGYSSWGNWNPASTTGGLPDYLVRKGKLVRSDTVPDTAGQGPKLEGKALTQGVRSAAISADLSRFAVVRADPPGTGERLWISDASGFLQPGPTGASIGRPTWGHSDATVLVPVDGGLLQVGVGNWSRPSRITVLAGGEAVRDVRAVRLALDGVRALIVAGTGPAARVYVGALISTPDVASAPVLLVGRLALVGAVQPLDVGWSGPTKAAIAARATDGRISLQFLPVDGSPGEIQETSLTGADPVRIAADPSANGSLDIPIEVGGTLHVMSSIGPTPSVSVSGAGAPFFPG
jgi:hypothetical protein